MYLDINSPFRRETIAENALKGRMIRGASESPEHLASCGAVVRWQKRKDLNILTPARRKGRILEKHEWKYISLE